MRILLLALVGLLLTACAAQVQHGLEPEVQRELVRAADAWSFSGRIAVKVENDPDASGQLSLRWNQDGETTRARFSGPLGVGGWELVRDTDTLTITSADGEETLSYAGPEAVEQFTRSQLGWSFPADSLRYWVRGLADPGSAAAQRFAEDGTVVWQSQLGWEVEYQRYADFGPVAMPTKISMAGRDVRLRIAISRWDITVPEQPATVGLGTSD